MSKNFSAITLYLSEDSNNYLLGMDGSYSSAVRDILDWHMMMSNIIPLDCDSFKIRTYPWVLCENELIDNLGTCANSVMRAKADDPSPNTEEGFAFVERTQAYRVSHVKQDLMRVCSHLKSSFPYLPNDKPHSLTISLVHKKYLSGFSIPLTKVVETLVCLKRFKEGISEFEEKYFDSWLRGISGGRMFSIDSNVPFLNTLNLFGYGEESLGSLNLLSYIIKRRSDAEKEGLPPLGSEGDNSMINNLYKG